MEEYHSRFDADHRSECSDCYEAYLDFCMEQEDDARLDAMIEAEEASDVIQPDEFDSNGIYGNDNDWDD